MRTSELNRRIQRLEAARTRRFEQTPGNFEFVTGRMDTDAENRPVFVDYMTDRVLERGEVGESEAAFWARLHPPGSYGGEFAIFGADHDEEDE